MMSFSDRPIARLCKVCGQFHSPTDSHLYDYFQPIDDDLTCEICLQPLVDPVDTKCGHTFCARCIKNYLKLQNKCPNDRNILKVDDLQLAPVIIRRYDFDILLLNSATSTGSLSIVFKYVNSKL